MGLALLHPLKLITDELVDHRDGKNVSSDRVEDYLEKIAENQSLNAFLEVYADEARQKARLLDEKRRSGLQTEPISAASSSR